MKCPDVYDASLMTKINLKSYMKWQNVKQVLKRKSIPAVDLFSAFVQERKDTGRIYLQKCDLLIHMVLEDIASLNKVIYVVKLTCPQNPLNDVNDSDGEISLCTLSEQLKLKV